MGVCACPPRVPPRETVVEAFPPQFDCRRVALPAVSSWGAMATTDDRIVLNEITNKKPSAWWLEELEREKIGCGPINNLDQVFDDPHVKAREMVVEMEHPAMGTKPMKLIANPIKLSKTPPTYRKAPPMLGQHTEDILKEAGLSDDEITKLKDDGTV